MHHFDHSSNSILQPKQINSQIIHSIKKARQKLSVDINIQSKQKSQQLFIQDDDDSLYHRHSLKSRQNPIDRTISVLKSRINELEKQKEKMQVRQKNMKQTNEIEINGLKSQLSKFLQKELELDMGDIKNRNNELSRGQMNEMKHQLKKLQIQIQQYKQKSKMIQQRYRLMQNEYKNLKINYEEIQKEKQKHIELNITQKMKLEQQIVKITNEKEVKCQSIKKLQQQNISLKRQIHNIFNKDRYTKQIQPINKKSQDQYQFQIKQISQKFNMKIKSQQKQINLLKKTLQKFKSNTNQSQLNKLAEYQSLIQELKQKNIQKQKKITLKNIQIQKITAQFHGLQHNFKQKQLQIKKLTQLIQKKQFTQSNSKSKNHIQSKNIKQSKQITKSVKRCQIDLKPSNCIGNSTNNIIITPNKNQINLITFQNSFDSNQQCNQPKTDRSQNLVKKYEDDRDQKRTLGDIVKQERALASLRSSYKKIDNKQLSLNEIMQQIRRKSEKINDLRSTKKSRDNLC